VRIIVPLEAWSKDADDLTAEPIRANPRDNAACGADNGCALWRENVDPFMPSSAASGRAPRVRKPRHAARGNRIGEMRRDRARRKRVQEPRPLRRRAENGEGRRNRDDRDDEESCSFHSDYVQSTRSFSVAYRVKGRLLRSINSRRSLSATARMSQYSCRASASASSRQSPRVLNGSASFG
jgi:hypothetical protein